MKIWQVYSPFKFVIGVCQNVIVEMQKSLFRFVTVRWLELWKKSLADPAFLFELGLLLNWLKSSFGQMKFCITCHHPPVTKGKAILCCDILGSSRGTTKINTLVRVKKRECDSHTDWTENCINFSGKERKSVKEQQTFF